MLVILVFEFLLSWQHVLFVYILIVWWCHVLSVFVLKWHVSLTPPSLCLISHHFVSTPHFCLLRLVWWVFKPGMPISLCHIVPVITCAVSAISKSAIPCVFDLTLFGFCIWDTSALHSVWLLDVWPLPVSWPDPVGFCILDTSALDSAWLLDVWPLPACWLRDCLFPLLMCCLLVGPLLLNW